MIILYTILFMAAVIAVFILINRMKNRFGKSEFDDVVLMHDKYYLFSNVFHSGGEGDSYTDCRIMEIDAFTGAVTRRLIPKYYSRLQILGVINGKIWLKDSGFCVFDPVIFNFVLTEKDISRKLSELNDVKVRQFYFNEIEKRAFFLAENGYTYSIHPDTFEVEPCQYKQNQEIIKKREKKEYVLPFKLNKSKDSERFELFYKNDRIGKDLSFIKPKFLQSTVTGEPVVLKEPESVAVFHYDTLNATSPFTITMVTKDGSVLWSISQEMMNVKNETSYERAAELKFLDYHSPLLIMVFDARRDIMIAVDTEKGTVIWNLKI